ncbi:MAG: AMIN domain-containing protein, partial [Mariprofundaceae bacterium]|nr:AMIN domain-containing protein [Mariprofundaceae bacterium]
MNNQTAYALLWRSVLMLGLLLLAVAPSHAANMIGLSLMDASDGDVVRIEVDQITSFERFELDGPPRLLIKLKDTTVGRSVHDVQATGDGVRSVKAGMDGTTALIELTLSERLPFRIEQKLNALLIRFSAASPTTMDGAQVTDVRVLDRDDVTELVLSGQNMNANYNVFLTENRQQLILDMWGARSALPKEFYEYAAQRIRNVVVGQSDDRLRIIVGLIPTASMQQQVEAKANQLIIRLGKVSASNSVVAQVVESIDFEPENQNARVIVRTSSTEPVIRVHEENDNVIIDVQHMTLAKGLER